MNFHPTLDYCNDYNDCYHLHIRIIVQSKEIPDIVKHGVRQRKYHIMITAICVS
jgi:hypothetical protein